MVVRLEEPPPPYDMVAILPTAPPEETGRLFGGCDDCEAAEDRQQEGKSGPCGHSWRTGGAIVAGLATLFSLVIALVAFIVCQHNVNQDLRGEVESVRSLQAAQVATIHQELLALTHQLEQQQDQIISLQEDLRNQTANLRSAADGLQRLEAEVETLADILASLRSKLAGLQGNSEAAVAGQQQLTSSLHDLQAQLVGLARSLDQSRVMDGGMVEGGGGVKSGGLEEQLNMWRNHQQQLAAAALPSSSAAILCLTIAVCLVFIV